MPTTTIRLPEDLKARISSAAERAGSTTHSFILEAIAEKAEQAERQEEFHAVAGERHDEIVASGQTIPWEKMRGYLQARAAGKKARRPKSSKLRDK